MVSVGRGDWMEIEDHIRVVIENSKYAGEYGTDDLISKMKASGRSGLAVSSDKEKQFLLIFVDGQPEGAALMASEGNLFGDKAIYLCKEDSKFKVYVCDRRYAESVAAGCRIYDKGHLHGSQLDDIPTIGGAKLSRGTLKLIILENNQPKQGVRVSIRKGRQMLLSELTGKEGNVTFKLVNGIYDCVIVDRDQNIHKFRIEFNDPRVETIIEIGGGMNE